MAMKQRWWWMNGEKEKSSNFIWTQNKSKKAFERLNKIKDGEYSPMKERDDESHDSSEETMATPNASTSSKSQRLRYDRKKQFNFTQSTAWTSKDSKLNDIESPSKPKKIKIIQNSNSKTRSHSKTGEKPIVKKKLEKTSATFSCNHLENHIHLSNKKALFYNMKMYYDSIGKDVFDYLPLTYHVKEGV
jgi:hypothetical protein